MSARVMFYVQHLLGIGHLKRASILAKAMAAAGLDVSVVLGGPRVDGIDFDGCARVMLPPAYAADASFSGLLDHKRQAVDDAWRDHRRGLLLAEFEAMRPDIVLIEQFPFGRRQFRFELMALLECARARTPRPWIVCSLRDALVRKSPERVREMIAVAAAWFDRVLVHGDPAVLPLDETLAEVEAIASRLSYTGYVADPAAAAMRPRDHTTGRGEVIVSVGGGAVGEPLLRAALAARPLTSLSGQVWRLICGPNMPAPIAADLRWHEASGVIVDRWRADLPVLLRNCVLSISQAGYNTIVDLLQAKTRAVVVPFATNNETEQEHRARTLAERGLLTMVESGTAEAPSPAALAAAIEAALATSPPPSAHHIDLGGAEAAARILNDLAADGQTARR